MSESNNKPVQQNQTNAYQRPVANVYDFYLTGNIGDAKEYQDWNQLMRSATENDGIVIKNAIRFPSLSNRHFIKSG